MTIKVGMFRLIEASKDHVSWAEDDYEDMLSPHNICNLCSDLTIEDFIETTWNTDDLDDEDYHDMIRFWTLVKDYIASRA